MDRTTQRLLDVATRACQLAGVDDRTARRCATKAVADLLETRSVTYRRLSDKHRLDAEALRLALRLQVPEEKP